MKPWKDLSMKERGAFIRVGVKNGITSVDGIRDAYNKFACGGHKFEDGGPKGNEEKTDAIQSGVDLREYDEEYQPREMVGDLALARQTPHEEGLQIVSPEFDLLTLGRSIFNMPRYIGFGNATRESSALFHNPNSYYRQGIGIIDDAKKSGVVRTAAMPHNINGQTVYIKDYTNPMFSKGTPWYRSTGWDVIEAQRGTKGLGWRYAYSNAERAPMDKAGRRIFSYQGQHAEAPSDLFNYYKAYGPEKLHLYFDVTNGGMTLPITGIDFLRDRVNKKSKGGRLAHKFDGTSGPTQWMFRNKSNPNDLISEAQYEKLFNTGDERFKNYEGVRVAVPRQQVRQQQVRQQQEKDHLYKDGRLDEITVRPDIVYNSDIRNIPALETTEEPISDEWRKRFARSTEQIRNQIKKRNLAIADIYNTLYRHAEEEAGSRPNYADEVRRKYTVFPQLYKNGNGELGIKHYMNMNSFASPMEIVSPEFDLLLGKDIIGGIGKRLYNISGVDKLSNRIIGKVRNNAFNKQFGEINKYIDELSSLYGDQVGSTKPFDIKKFRKDRYDDWISSYDKYNDVKRLDFARNNNWLDARQAAEKYDIRSIIKRNVNLRNNVLKEEYGTQLNEEEINNIVDNLMKDIDNIEYEYAPFDSNGNRLLRGSNYNTDTGKITITPNKDKAIMSTHYSADDAVLHETEHSLQHKMSDMVEDKVREAMVKRNATLGELDEITNIRKSLYTVKERGALNKAYGEKFTDSGDFNIDAAPNYKSADEQGATNAQLVNHYRKMGYNINDKSSLPDIIQFEIDNNITAPLTDYNINRSIILKRGISDQIANGYVRDMDYKTVDQVKQFVVDELNAFLQKGNTITSNQEALSFLKKGVAKFQKLKNDAIKEAMTKVGITVGGVYTANRTSGNKNKNSKKK